MASDNDITVRKRRCKDVFDGDLAHYIPGSSDDAQTYSKKAEWWAVKWPDGVDDGKVDALDYSSKKWAVYTDGPVDTANNLFSSKQYALNAEEQAGISLSWANKSQEWAESDAVIEGTETSHSSKHWSSVSKEWSDDALSYSIAADNSRQLAFEWAEKMNGPVTGDQYSAKYWAGKAEERSGGSEQWSIISHSWANGGLAEGATQPSSTDTNSSLYWAYQSAQSAASADQYQQQAYSYQEESRRQKQDAVTARTGAETAQVKAETAQRLAETAQTAAETAQTAAETAQGKAEDAQEAAEIAQAAAESAQTAAEAAQTKSEQAQDAAETAQTAAEAAQGKAQTAQNAAEAAQAAAEIAQGKAEDAQTAAETAQGKSEVAQTAAETAQTAAETAQDITESARDRAQEWAESDQAITVPGDADTHYSAKKHAQDALDTFGLTANVYIQTVGVYNDTTIASAAAHGHADDAMRANESAQEAKGDAIAAKTAAETAQIAAEAARDLAQEWADNNEDVPVGDTDDKYSAKHWSIKAENAVASLGNVAMRDAANVFQSDNQFNGNVAIGLPGTPGDKAKCQLNRTSGSYNASGALIDNLGRYMLITYNGASNKTNFITYINNHSSDLDITASAADGNYIYLEAKVAGTYANEIEYYAVGSFYNNDHGYVTQGTKTAGTDETKAQCQVSLTYNFNNAGYIVYTKGGVVKGIAVAPVLTGSRTLQELAALINEKEDLDFTAEISGTYLILTNKEFGEDTTLYCFGGCFAQRTHLKVKQGSLAPGTEDIPGSDNTLTLNGESVPTHFGNNEYAGINIFTGPVGIQSTGSFTNNGVTVLNGETVLNGQVSGPGLGDYITEMVNPFANVTSLSNDWHELKNIDPFIADYTDISLYLLNVTGTAYIFTTSHKWSNMQSLKIVLPKASSVAGFYNHSTDAGDTTVRDIIIIAPKAVMASDFRNHNLGGNMFVYMPNDSSGKVFMWNRSNNFYYYSLKRTSLNSFWNGGGGVTYGKKAVITTGKVTTIVDAFSGRLAMTDLTWTAFDTDNVQLQHPAVYVVSASTAFKNCKTLKDSCFPTVWSSLNSGPDMFLNCEKLSAATANAILDSLPEWTDGASHVITFTGTAAATSWAAGGADLSHIEAAEAKGWTVEGRPTVTE